MENEVVLTSFVFPWSPLCPHWCPCLVSSRLSYPTGFTKLKRDWLFCSNFLCKPSPANRFCRCQEWWSYVCITVNHYSVGFLSQASIRRTIRRIEQLQLWKQTCKMFTSFHVLKTTLLNLPAHSPHHQFYFARHVMLKYTVFLPTGLFLFNIHKHNNCYTFMHVLIMCFIKHTQSGMHKCTYTFKFTPRSSCVRYRANADLKASPLPQKWHQLVLSLALPLLLSSFLSSFISWAHLLTLQKVFLTCLSPLPPPPLPPPPTLSSIESMRLCLKLMYFVELTLWRLHHLDVGKWYWDRSLVFKERRAVKHSVWVWHGELADITLKEGGGKQLFHLCTCTSLQLWTIDCEEGGRFGTFWVTIKWRKTFCLRIFLLQPPYICSCTVCSGHHRYVQSFQIVIWQMMSQ